MLRDVRIGGDACVQELADLVSLLEPAVASQLMGDVADGVANEGHVEVLLVPNREGQRVLGTPQVEVALNHPMRPVLLGEGMGYLVNTSHDGFGTPQPAKRCGASFRLIGSFRGIGGFRYRSWRGLRDYGLRRRLLDWCLARGNGIILSRDVCVQ